MLGENRRSVLMTAAGIDRGEVYRRRLLGLVPNSALLPLLAAILFLSAVKAWRHK